MVGDEGVAHRVDVDEAERGHERDREGEHRDHRPAVLGLHPARDGEGGAILAGPRGQVGERHTVAVPVRINLGAADHDRSGKLLASGESGAVGAPLGQPFGPGRGFVSLQRIEHRPLGDERVHHPTWRSPDQHPGIIFAEIAVIDLEQRPTLAVGRAHREQLPAQRHETRPDGGEHLGGRVRAVF